MMQRPRCTVSKLVRTDPRGRPHAVWGWLDRLLAGKLHDDRDAAFVQDVVLRAMLVPVGLGLFVPGVFSWPLALLYLLLLVPQCGPTAVVVHLLTHRPLFVKGLRPLEGIVTWGIAPFFGLDPGGYLSHHVGMHHVEGNDERDLSSTMAYRRDSLWDFCLYWWRFQLVGKLELFAYLRRTGRSRLFRRLLRGELLHKGLIVVGFLVNWQAALVVFVIPHLVVRWGLMMGNWCQHAFIDPQDPADPYKNSVTLINAPYNHTMYNDGYHCGHHVRATAHWAEAPEAFEANLDVYAHRRAVVFDGLRGFMLLWWLLMRRRYDVLAQHLVPWSPDMASIEARMAFLKARTAPVRSGGLGGSKGGRCSEPLDPTVFGPSRPASSGPSTTQMPRYDAQAIQAAQMTTT